MTGDPVLFYLLLTLLCLVLQGLFAMLEMACVSFNRVRLQYYLSQGSQRAKWLSYLIERPAWVFGTTLIGVNATMIIGSECSRRLYEALGYSPDLAPLTQIFVVLVFAEIAPMLAGRLHSEHVGLLGAPFLFALSFLLRPVIVALDLLCRLVNRWMGAPVSPDHYLSREELQNIIEEREEVVGNDLKDEVMHTIIPKIFACRSKTAKDLMKPLSEVLTAPLFASASEIRSLVKMQKSSFVALYQKRSHNVLSILFLRDLLRAKETDKVKDYARAPWFITESASILQILRQFRSNNQSVAVVLDATGLTTGLLSLDEITDEIFGISAGVRREEEEHNVVVERRFPADFPLSQFNAQFQANLHYKEAATLSEVMQGVLGHLPTKGESIRIDGFELIVEEASLLGVKEILIRTL